MKKNIIAFIIGAMIGLLLMPEGYSMSDTSPNSPVNYQNMSIINTLERLNVPISLAANDGIYVQSKIRSLVCREKWQIQRGRRTLVSRNIEHVEAAPANPQKWMALNYLSQKLNVGDYSLVGPNTLRKEGSTKVITTGYLAGQQVWFMGGTIQLNENGYRQSFDSIYMNIDKSGQPTSGIISMPVIIETTIPRGAGQTTITNRVNRTFTRVEIEALGYNSDELAAGCYQEFTLERLNPETHLINVSTDLEEIGEGVYWPNAFFNGRDDSEFNHRTLIAHYAPSSPLYDYRITGYNTSTNADYPAPNYSGLGNGGKWFDRPMDPQQSKPIRCDFGSSYGIEETADELIVTYKEGEAVAAIGIEILYRGTGGKGRDHFIGVNLLTGEKFWDHRTLFASLNTSAVTA